MDLNVNVSPDEVRQLPLLTMLQVTAVAIEEGGPTVRLTKGQPAKGDAHDPEPDERAKAREALCLDLRMLFGVVDELPDTDDVELLNQFGIGVQGDLVGPIMAIGGMMSKDNALVTAAWLVALADDGKGRFASILNRLLNT